MSSFYQFKNTQVILVMPHFVMKKVAHIIAPGTSQSISGEKIIATCRMKNKNTNNKSHFQYSPNINRNLQ